ncbi:MAG: molecular chaperone DnaK [Nannocystaceae bacterium]|nr:molecular chaperone DnaK [Nannocystaceae bacterium]
MAKTIGIDLGTTNSVVAVMEGGQAVIISNEEGGRTTPSVVAFEEGGNCLVGQQARRQAITNPEATVYSTKRFMGRSFAEVAEDAKRLPFTVEKSSTGGTQFKLRNKAYSPPQVSARILTKLKKAAEDYLGETVDAAVITVPAYFNDAQRQATKDAGEIAGLNVRRIVNEPTAAALAFARDKDLGSEERVIAVYDLGGGTFDVSVLEVAEDVVEVISTAGDTHLGGDDFDDVLIDWLLAEFKADSGLDASADKLVRQRLKEAAEKAKVELSTQTETEINLPFLTADASGPKHLQKKLSRAKFESLIAPLVERTLGPVKRALSDAGKKTAEIDEILLVGGSSRVPLVQKTVREFFGKDPNKGVNPDEVVALGAAVQAGVLTGEVKDMVLVDVTPLSLGIETLGGVMTVLIPRNTTVPMRKSEVFTTASDNQPSVQVLVLQGERKMAADNRTLANFGLEGLPTAPRGTPQIEVAFDIDANGIVHVSATDLATGKDHKVTISSSSALSPEEIERMVDEAKRNEEVDTRLKDEVDKRNTLEALVHQTQSLLGEHGALPSELRGDVETALGEANSAIEAQDPARIEGAQTRLTAAAHELSKAMYANAGEPAAPSEGPGDQQANDGVIDAEFEEKRAS